MTNSSPQNAPLIVISHSPYDGALARGALDAALSFAVFGQEPKVLFSGAGALCLAQREPAGQLQRKSVRKVIDSLPLYDIDEVFVESSALEAFDLSPDELPSFAKTVGSATVKQLHADSLHIVSF